MGGFGGFFNALLARQVIHPILDNLGLNINDAVNGMMLDKKFHERLGTREYREFVVNRLRGIETKEEFVHALDGIKEMLYRMQKEYIDNRVIPRFGQ